MCQIPESSLPRLEDPPLAARRPASGALSLYEAEAYSTRISLGRESQPQGTVVK